MPEYTGQVTHVELAWFPLWLIPLFPLLGAAINAVFGRRLQQSPIGTSFAKRQHTGSFLVSAVAIGALLVSFALGVTGFVQLFRLSEPGHRYLYSFGWQMARIGTLDVNFAFAMDSLGAVMTLVVTGVGALIHIYATSYMATERSYWRFFSYFNLFIFAMLLLVLGDNFVVMFFGWEGVGLCSYLLIGFWYQDYQKATAGTKAFLVNRIGDFGFIAGIALLFWGLGGHWDGVRGDYVPSVLLQSPRFISVAAEPLAHGSESHGPAPAGHGTAAPSASERMVPSTRDVVKISELPVPDDGSPEPPEAGHAHGHSHGPPPKPLPPREMRSADELRARAGSLGTLTMTSYPGAKVYFGVTSMDQLSRTALPECKTLPGWREGASEPALRPDCYATSPFLRKTIPAGIHAVAIVPGGGAVVTGTGDEVASLRVGIEPGSSHVLTAVGPSVTFREIHDQLVVTDADGNRPFRDALVSKKLWPNSWPLSAWGGVALITLACFCFFVGATGKSAQIPLYTWLPDAMAGPTPVSALIHAATMVTAGVYMVARLNFLFALSPRASGVVAMVGAATALFAASIGFFQYDIKKVLAYSTVSQLGFMFIGVGVGAYWAGVFHLVTHAFFKACLFLGSGSVIHGMHAVEHDADAAQDMRNMGGLKRVMPWTSKTYFIACLAITAAPIPLLAGFWSKDEILWKAFNTQNIGWVPGWAIYAAGLIAAIGTSFYMWRSYYLTFEGAHAKKAIAKKVHESPAAITYVLWALAGLSVFAGALLGFSLHFVGGHGEPLLEKWLHPTLAHAEVSFHERGLGFEYALMALSVGLAIAAWSLARKRYGAARPKNWEEIERALPGFETIHHKYYVDEFYARTFVAAVLRIRRLLGDMDRWVVDGLVNASAVATKAWSWLIGKHDKHVVDGAVNLVADGLLWGGGKLRRLQSGRVQSYVYGILGGLLFFAILRYFLL